MISHDALMAIRAPAGIFEWRDRDSMLYALAIGLGDDPLSPRALRYIYERELATLPTFATVAAWGSVPSFRETGIDRRKAVHATHEILVHRALPPAGRVCADGGVTAVIDKGDTGALIETEIVLRDADTGEAYVTNRFGMLARGDGHFGGSRSNGTVPHPMPGRAPDRTIAYATRADQAALYRLLGDRNPLHIDPEAARIAGFDRPILHGLCTFGMTSRAVMEAFADMDAARIASHSARFSAPVFPGDTLTIDLWIDQDVVSFEVFVPARNVKVIGNGRARLL